MIITIGLMILGIFLGRFLRGKEGIKKTLSFLLMLSVCILLFIMGIRVALNPDLKTAFSSVGVVSLILFFFATAGSILLTWLFTKRMGQNANNQVQKK